MRFIGVHSYGGPLGGTPVLTSMHEERGGTGSREMPWTAVRRLGAVSLAALARACGARLQR